MVCERNSYREKRRRINEKEKDQAHVGLKQFSLPVNINTVASKCVVSMLKSKHMEALCSNEICSFVCALSQTHAQQVDYLCLLRLFLPLTVCLRMRSIIKVIRAPIVKPM